MKVAVIGAGTFGTALANAVNKENEIILFARNPTIIQNINTTRKNLTYFPTKVLSKQIIASNNVDDIIDADLLFLCIPSYTVIDFVSKISLSPKTVIVNGAKGFGIGSKFIPESLNEILPNEVASMKGPSFANEMIFDIPTAFTIASKNKSNFSLVPSAFRRELIIVDYTTDIIGTEFLSIIKNIYAIIVGIVDASFNSSNVRFLIFTKALHEMKRLLNLFNVCEETIFCYAGIGDFGLTALNDLSRNRTLGLLIGKGFFNRDVNNMVVLEGVRAIDNVINKIPQEAQGELHLLMSLSNLFEGKISVKEFINKVIYQEYKMD